MTPLEEWLDGIAVEDMLNVSTRTLQKYRSSGRLPFLKIGNKIFYKRTAVEAYLEMLYEEQNAHKRAALVEAYHPQSAALSEVMHPQSATQADDYKSFTDAHTGAYKKKGEAYD